MYGQPAEVRNFIRFDVEGLGIYLKHNLKIHSGSLLLKLDKIAEAEIVIPIGIDYYNGVPQSNPTCSMKNENE